MKTRLMKKRLKGEWRLVISIHGAEDVIATSGGFLRNRSLFVIVPKTRDSWEKNALNILEQCVPNSLQLLQRLRLFFKNA